jgi:hypothetical protein
MPGMLMPDRIMITCGSMPSAHYLVEMLPEPVGEVRLVVDDGGADVHSALPATTLCPPRGKRTVNSVNAPTSLSTSIVP